MNSKINIRKLTRSDKAQGESWKFTESILKDNLNLKSNSPQINVNEVEDQKKLLQKVCELSITLPDERFAERVILSDHSVKQMKYNNSQKGRI